MKPKLLFITRNYPYRSKGGEIMFIKPEIQYLKKYFNITVAPRFNDGSIVDDIADIQVDTSLAEFMQTKRKSSKKLLQVLSTFFSKVFYREIYLCIQSGILPDLRQIAKYLFLFQITTKWLKQQDKYMNYDIFYTYWANAGTSGLIKCCKNSSKLVLTRVHGYDVYHERSSSGYIPGYDYNFLGVDKIFTVSEHAKEYLIEYGIPESQIILSRLGVGNQEMSSSSEDGKLCVLSCSNVIPLKRVEAIYETLYTIAKERKDLHIKWTHLGGGKLLSSLKSRVESSCPSNLFCNLPGKVNHSEVISFYKNNPIDLFIHASKSEGLPVSMQESLSFGVPVISTKVGGVPEIVVPQVGLLVDSSNPSEKLAEAVQDFLSYDDRKIKELRKAAQKHQRNLFDKNKNFNLFAKELLSLYK